MIFLRKYNLKSTKTAHSVLLNPKNHFESTKMTEFVLLTGVSFLSLSDFNRKLVMKLFCLRTMVLIGLLFTCFQQSYAQEDKVRFAYDVDFEMNFDNREFDRSSFSKAMTIFGARLTPSVGIAVPQGDKGMNHRLMLGIDVMKDFGASPISPELSGGASDETAQFLNNRSLLREITLYYMLEKKSAKTGLHMYAGIFPRAASEGSYSEAFFSDSLRFYDNNLEGLLLKIYRPKAYWEVGCDWMGKPGYARKEKFMIFSSGVSHVASFMDIGYAAYMYHFAGSAKARGVVDNILINPYMKFDFGSSMNMQEFSLRFGWLQAMQHDRVFVGHYVFPCGGEFDLEMRNWNVGIRNKLFYGTDMMPYYNSSDAGGDKYGNRLYMGDPFYRIHDDGAAGPGMYDRFEVFYEPHVGKYLSIRISARFHFHDFRYSGCQQMVGIRFNLHELMNR